MNLGMDGLLTEVIPAASVIVVCHFGSCLQDIRKASAMKQISRFKRVDLFLILSPDETPTHP